MTRPSLSFKDFPISCREGSSIDLGGIGVVRIVKTKSGSVNLRFTVPEGMRVNTIVDDEPAVVALPLPAAG